MPSLRSILWPLIFLSGMPQGSSGRQPAAWSRLEMHFREELPNISSLWDSSTVVTGPRLRIATANIWSGLTYEGTLSMGRIESDERLEVRRVLLVEELRRRAPDIVLLQEVNPSSSLSRRIADALGYDVVAQRVQGGMKVGPIGIPTNLNEGIAILARKELNLQPADVWLLSTGFGAIGDDVSFHLREENIALVARITLPTGRAYIINTHLIANPEDTEASRERLLRICTDRALPSEETRNLLAQLADGEQRRRHMVERLLERMRKEVGDDPVILGGDLNATPTSLTVSPIFAAGFVDAIALGGAGELPTWDPAVNTNILSSPDASLPNSPEAEFEAWYDLQARRIDHIFLSRHFAKGMRISAERFLDRPADSIFTSDHFGLVADLDLGQISVSKAVDRAVAPGVDVLPIISYDTDVGLGLGVKSFFLNELGMNESFDVLLFNSSKGERWYRLVFSMPDFELRQGTVYPLAIDVTIDYDKYVKNSSFFGVGNSSQFKDREMYSREPFEISLTFSRGLSTATVVQAGIRYRFIRNFGFSDTSRLRQYPPPNDGRVSSVGLLASFRHDTRDSYINPSRGLVLQGELEYVPDPSWSDGTAARMGAWFQYYTTLLYPKTILAARCGAQALMGSNFPVQTLLSIGGNQTLRGSPQDRFLDRIAGVANVELRPPLIWRFGMVAGLDAGRVWQDAEKVGIEGWHSNSVVGVRFFMDTFVVRADLGFGSETTGFYLNFGHLF